MTVALMTDLEGISGVSDITMITDETSEGYRFACNRLAADANAAIRGCFDGGATRVFVIDGHGAAHNLDEKQLDCRAEKVNIEQWIQYTRAGEIDLFMEIGAHTKAGTINGFLDHVQSSTKWFSYTIQGVEYGELAQGGLFMGAFGVPFVLVSGDDAVCQEAQDLLETVECASVKTAIGRNCAKCIENAEAEERIYAAARKAIKLYNVAKPLRFPMPLDIRVTYTRTDYCDEKMKILQGNPQFTRLDARTIRRTVNKIESYTDLLI